VIAFIGAWALTPWNILSSASALLNFMDGYIIWVTKSAIANPETRLLIHSQLAPITGILLADYWVVQKQAYDVDAMYDPSGRYRYNQYGTNWRAVVAWFVAWIPLTPGFASGVGFCLMHCKLSWILTLTIRRSLPLCKSL
jgi:NCS1 family nucleobase:cation symporter-1